MSNRDQLVSILLRAVSDGHCLDSRADLEELANYLSANVAPVVRCKDCKHGTVFSKEKHLVDCPYYDDQLVDFEHFCSYGKRRDGEG